LLKPVRGIRTPGRGLKMKYIVAWALGVPGILVVLWFLLSHH
jgi:hypothetical protein